ncbi:hypothetical protein EG68_03911, partial [Paragonimus skrjabini miyazakii]
PEANLFSVFVHWPQVVGLAGKVVYASYNRLEQISPHKSYRLIVCTPVFPVTKRRENVFCRLAHFTVDFTKIINTYLASKSFKLIIHYRTAE